MKQSFKKLIGIWVGELVVVQIGTVFMREVGVIIPAFIESLLAILQIVPLIILSFLIVKDKSIRKSYRILAGAFLIVSILACILPCFLSA